jgi:hypothetical protein
MRRLLPSLLLAVAIPAAAQDAPAEPDFIRSAFNAEVCKVDGLTDAQCNCAWQFLEKKLSPQDLKLGVLLAADNSEDKELRDKVVERIEKLNASEKRQDAMASEMAALIIEAEDACM